MKFTIAHIEESWDMRQKNALLEGHHARRLKHGECLVAFNGAFTIIRVVFAGGFFERHAPPGEVYDLAAVINMMRTGLGIQMLESDRVRRAA